MRRLGVLIIFAAILWKLYFTHDDHDDSAMVQIAHDEHQYLNLIRDVLERGATRPDRTGTGTLSLFAPPNLRFSLANATLPLLTTKRTFLRGILEELLWFVHGKTDSKLLSEKGVKIWDGNGSKEFPEKQGLGHRREKECIRKIKEDPTDR